MRADFAIVGAGIVGCLTAREVAARAPGCSVVVLDRDTVGSGATRRSAGLAVPRGSTGRVRRMADYSQRYYQALKGADPALPIHPLPLRLVAPEGGSARLREVYLPGCGLAASANGIEPPVVQPPGTEVYTLHGAHYADVYALTQALARASRPAVAFREGVRVDEVEEGDDAVRLELGTGETVHAGHVVLAPGPWVGAPAWRDLLAPLGVRVKKIVALHVAAPPGPGEGVVLFDAEDAFLLPLADRGHWLFSYTRTEWDVDPDTVGAGLSPADVAQAHLTLHRYAPALAGDRPAGRVFCDAYAPAGEPVVAPVGATSRIVFAGAAGGSGYRLAPAIAAAAADLLPIPRSRR